MIYTPQDPQKAISLEIKTVTIDEESPEAIAEELGRFIETMLKGEDVSPEEMSKALENDEINEIELCTEATIETNQRGYVELSYMENEDDPQIATLSKIIFHPDSPELVAMTKEGAMNTVLSFEEGKTHICTYETPFMPLKVYVTTNMISNSLLTNGRMKLDYILNINDTPPQHFCISVKIKEAPEDILKDFLK